MSEETPNPAIARKRGLSWEAVFIDALTPGLERREYVSWHCMRGDCGACNYHGRWGNDCMCVGHDPTRFTKQDNSPDKYLRLVVMWIALSIIISLLTC